jgi:hypothetical protein
MVLVSHINGTRIPVLGSGFFEKTKIPVLVAVPVPGNLD